MVKKLDESDWNSLVYAIEQGDCILMLGPDAIVETVGDINVPLMQNFAQELRQELERREKLPSQEMLPEQASLAQVAQTFKNCIGAGDLRVKAQDFFQRKDNLKCRFLEDLAALPFKLIVNSIPGKHVEKAFQANPGKHPKSDWYHAGGQAKDMVHEGTPDEPLVYHLYGCVDDLKSLVLTEHNLLDFLVAVVAGKPPLPNNIRSAFNSKDACFLFLGFGFKHWYLRILLHVLYHGGGENRSFALEKFDDSIGTFATETTKLFFQEGHRIYFFDMDLDFFAAELRDRFMKKQKNMGQGQVSGLPPNAPRVFLCHASENKDYAENLFAKLKDKGIDTWLDKENIRGGDAWNSLIETVITKDIDYFVVLQSKTFNQKIESYFNKEIKVALDRQALFGEQINFIIPTLIETCEMQDRLKHLHTINLTHADGFENLVKAIRRDTEIRRKRSS